MLGPLVATIDRRLLVNYRADPVYVERATSTYFERVLPPGSFELDCALMVRDVAATWEPHPAMRVREEVSAW